MVRRGRRALPDHQRQLDLPTPPPATTRSRAGRTDPDQIAKAASARRTTPSAKPGYARLMLTLEVPRDRVWEPLLRRVGLHHRGQHQLRHSYASLLLGRGVAPKYVQGQLGHASLAVTLGVDSHLLPGEYGRLPDQLDPQPATDCNPGATTSAAEKTEH